MNATKRDDGAGRTNAERSVIHVDQYRRAYRRLHLLLRAVFSRRGHALHAPPPRRSFVQRPEGWHGDVVVVLRPCPAGGCESSVDREGRILRSRARRVLPVPAYSMHFSFIFIPWYIRGNTTREALLDLFAREWENLRAYTFFILCHLSFDIKIVFLFHLFFCNMCLLDIEETNLLINFFHRSTNFSVTSKL